MVSSIEGMQVGLPPLTLDEFFERDETLIDLVQGWPVVSPAPAFNHQLVLSRLARLLDQIQALVPAMLESRQAMVDAHGRLADQAADQTAPRALLLESGFGDGLGIDELRVEELLSDVFQHGRSP